MQDQPHTLDYATRASKPPAKWKATNVAGILFALTAYFGLFLLIAGGLEDTDIALVLTAIGGFGTAALFVVILTTRLRK